jgi:precorrin-6B methylase 2
VDIHLEDRNKLYGNVGTPVREVAPAVPIEEPLHPVFALPKAHVKMLDDRARTAGYIEALREVVRPGAIVVDIGTGTGVLALAAAQAGAAHVYAIESGRMGRAAEKLFAGSGVADRITLVRGWSASVELPEPADVIVGETIGREPLEQRVLELMLDARERMLKPGGRLVPSALSIHALPVSIPSEQLDRMDFTPAAAERWRSWYGIDFRPLLDAPVARLAFKDPAAVRSWPRLSDPVRVAHVDFAAQPEAFVDTAAVAVATRSGAVNGVVLFFDLQLSEGAAFTTHPDLASATTSWRHAVYFPPPLEVEVGDELVVSYRYAVTGAPDGISVVRAEPS